MSNASRGAAFGVRSLVLGLDVSPRRLGWGLVDLRRAKETAAGRFMVYAWKTSPYGHGTYLDPATFEFARAVAAGEIDVRRDLSGNGRYVYVPKYEARADADAAEEAADE